MCQEHVNWWTHQLLKRIEFYNSLFCPNFHRKRRFQGGWGSRLTTLSEQFFFWQTSAFQGGKDRDWNLWVNQLCIGTKMSPQVCSFICIVTPLVYAMKAPSRNYGLSSVWAARSRTPQQVSLEIVFQTHGFLIVTALEFLVLFNSCIVY
jgi:hypothetical protein